MPTCRFLVLLTRLVVCVSVLFASATFASAADRVALVIGNGAYQNAITLPNPPRDAKAMASLLRALKFEVVEGEDLDKAALEAKLRQFADAAETAKAAFVFYAGHGMQVDGKNYIIPIDAKLADRSALDFEVVPVDRIVKYAKRDNGVAIVLLDACRDNPLSRRFTRSFVASRSAGTPQGLAAPSVVGGGVIIGFATAPGEEASDGVGDHSPFTAALLRELPKPGVDIQMALTHVSGDVKRATHGEQVPWRSSDLQSDFYLNPAPVTTTKGGNSSLPPDEALWSKLALSDDAAAIRLFIQAYPASPHVPEAKTRLASLTKNEKFRTTFSGELKTPESQTYVTFRDTTVTREGPGSKYASRFNIKPGETVKALGAFLPEYDPSAPYMPDAERTWVKVATTDGNQGFALGHDLLTPEQFAKRRRLLAQAKLLEADFERAKKSWGPLGQTAGIWSYGTKCLQPIPGGLNINLGLDLFSRWIFWDEGSTYYRVNVAHPDHIYHGALRRRNSTRFKGTGRVQLYELKYDTGKDLIGFKGDQGYFHKTGTTYGLMHRCGTVQLERYGLQALWAKWVEVQQRQPDKK